jgi:WD40 repeat protein
VDESADVFISYARDDGENFAGDLRRRIEQDAPDLVLWRDREEMEGDIPWWRQITEALNVVPAMVLVLTPAALRSPYVSKEWRYARQQGVRVLPVKGIPDDQLDIATVPRWMSKVHWYDAEREWHSVLRVLRHPERPPRVPFMAPDLPRDYVQRPEEFAVLKSLLLDFNSAGPVAITTALQGAGGFGKTTLAAALCHDGEIVEAFGDGILWVTLGESPNLIAVVNGLCNAMTGRNPGFIEVELAAGRLAELLEDRDCLLVLDDVWDQAHLRPFMRGVKNGARIITTRRRTVVTGAEARRVDVDEMTADQAVEILIARLDPRPTDLQPFRDLARRLGEWPMLLGQFGAAVRNRLSFSQSLSDALTAINKALDNKGVTALDPKQVATRQASIARTIEVSLDQLGDDERVRYTELAIFPEDVAIPLTSISALWGTDEFETESLALRLGDLSLVKLDLQTVTIRLHDVMRQYLAENLHETAPLHARLLDAWGDLHHLPDSYAWRWVAHHLTKANRLESLRGLLVDFEWLRAKLEATDADAVIGDFEIFADAEDLRVIQGALQLAAHVLSQAPEQLSSQLLGRLGSFSSPAIQTLLGRARSSTSGPWVCPLIPSLTPPGGPLMRILTGHDGTVYALGITRDGRRVVSGSSDHTVAVWDLATGQRMRILSGHSGKVQALAITPDGQLALSAALDGTVRVWDLATGQCRHVLKNHGGGVRAVAITPNGHLALAGVHNRTVRVWDLATGQHTGLLKGHGGAVYAVVATPDSRHALSGASDRIVRMWDLASARCERTLEGHGAPVTSLAVSPDGRFALSGSDDHTVRIWDLATGRYERALEGHNGRVTAVAVTSDSHYAVTGANDGTVRVWNLATGRSEYVLRGYGGGVNAVALALTPDGCLAVTGSEDRTVRIWDLNSGRGNKALGGHDAWVRAVAVNPDGRFALSGSSDRTVRIWDLASLRCERTLVGHKAGVREVATTLDGRFALSASNDHTVRIWDLATGLCKRTLEGHDKGAWAVKAFDTIDAQLALSASGDGTLRIWDLATGQCKKVLRGHGGGVRALAVSPDGRIALSGSSDRTVRIWDLVTAECSLVLEGHARGIWAVAVTPDGRHGLSGSSDSTVRIWELATGRCMSVLEKHDDLVAAVSVNPNGDFAVSASLDRTVQVWELATGRTIATFYGDAGFPACAVVPDGRLVVAGDTAGLVHFLRLIDVGRPTSVIA